MLVSFAALTQAYVTSDFSVVNVVANSHSAKPLLYKIRRRVGEPRGLDGPVGPDAGPVRRGGRGFGSNLPATLKARVLSVQGMIGVGFLLFILATSNPFIRVDPPPPDGQDLNPLLQDPGLAFHPPFLYLGYVGFRCRFPSPWPR